MAQVRKKSRDLPREKRFPAPPGTDWLGKVPQGKKRPSPKTVATFPKMGGDLPHCFGRPLTRYYRDVNYVSFQIKQRLFLKFFKKIFIILNKNDTSIIIFVIFAAMRII